MGETGHFLSRSLVPFPVRFPPSFAELPGGYTLFFGLVQVLVASFGPLLDQTVVEAVLTIAGFTTGITLGVFLLGIFTTHAGSLSTLGFGLLASVVWPADPRA